MSKPNNTPPPWSEAPEWAMWLAQDEDGYWWWYENEPKEGLDQFFNDDPIGGVHPAGNDKRVNRYWRDTLQKRPENE